jgi:MoaA/NifB/PqqE/SkfB family radical SAM enzyme
MSVQELANKESVIISQQTSKLVRDRFEVIRLKLRVFPQVFGIILRKTGKPLAALRLIWQIMREFKTIFGEPMPTKVAKVGKRYFWHLGVPGYPSEALLRMHRNEASHFIPGQQATGLRSLLFAITKKCPMNCEHCFEWDNLNQQEELSTGDLVQIVLKYQEYGTTQIMFSGGEPMLRVNDICEVLERAHSGTDFWIISSGLGLNLERAHRLKKAGLTGVMISLDHFEADKHNAFRGFENAYNGAIQAVINANQVGLVTTLSLCATKDFTTAENLAAYMNLAKTLGVSFVQILEPRASGRYKGMEVELGAEEILLLDKTYIEYNTSPAYVDFPIVNYLGFHQRKVGCFGAGNRFFYIDTDGDAHVCPFCTNKVANTLQFSAEDIVNLLGQHACHGFDKG